MTSTTYVFDTGEQAERARLAAQSALWDPFTLRRLAGAGVGEGWRCLEIGGGTGSVTRWLVERVGELGHVVATDLETRWLEPLAAPNCEVRRHDVVTDALEESAYDLVHARLVLMHLPARDDVLTKLVAALRPGGWLVLEDYDLSTIDVSDPPHAAWAAASCASKEVLTAAGADPHFGRKLAHAMRSRGLDEIDAEAMLAVQRAPEAAGWLAPLLHRMRDALLATGVVSARELDDVLAELGDDDSHLTAFTPLLVSARGRVPWDGSAS